MKQSAWASALLILFLMGNAKAWSRGISNSTVPTLFLYALLLKTICKKALYGS